MKKIFILIGIFLLSNSIFGQETVKTIAEMAIFPGCEVHKGDNSKLSKCMSEKLSLLLAKELEGFSDVAEKENITEAVSRLKFIINKEGKIEKIESLEGGNKLLDEHSIKALESISQRMIEKGEIIQPAKLEDGTLANLRFSIPVRFIVEKDPIDEFNDKELVFMTFKDSVKKFEFRISKNNQFMKIYEIEKGKKDVFLGEFKEAINLEPYKTLFDAQMQVVETEGILVAEGFIDDKLHQVKIKYASDTQPAHVQVIKIDSEGKEETLQVFQNENEILLSEYSSLLVR